MNFITELKRRNVFRVAIAYVLFAWVLLQGADFAFDLVGAPDWVIRSLTVVVAIGLPVALFFAWAFEVTPEGVKRESKVDRSASITPQTGRKLDRAIIVFLMVAVALLSGERFLSPAESVATRDHTPSVSILSKSVAVLPFVNMSADADNEYFSDGISEEILNVLAGIPELQVAARTSAFAYKGSKKSISEIAEELNVNHVLEGSVRKDGNHVRITAQLIKADDGFHVWSETYDRELTNIFAIQDEIASNIAQVLEVRLLGSQKSYTTIQDLSPEAYEKFLKARFLMRRRNEVASQEAALLSRQVLVEAPDFPRGLIQLAENLAISFDAGTHEAEVRELTERALSLDPDLATVHMMQGQIAGWDRDQVASYKHLLKAIELDPDEPRPYHWLGILLANVGYLEQAREQLQKAVDLEPDHANANGYLGFVELLLGNFDRAEQHVINQVRLGNDFGAIRQIHLDLLRGNIEQAEETINRLQGVNEVQKERLYLLLDAMRDPTDIKTYTDFVATEEELEWHIMQELFILEQFEIGTERVVKEGDPPRHAWAVYWSEARRIAGFYTAIKQRNIDLLWDEIGPPPACRKIGDEYDCNDGVRD